MVMKSTLTSVCRTIPSFNMMASRRTVLMASNVSSIYKNRMYASLANESWFKSLGLSTDKINPGVYSDGKAHGSGEILASINPATNEVIAKTQGGTIKEYELAVSKMTEAQKVWRNLPTPARGEIVRQIRDAILENKEALGKLVSLEMGKIYTEGLGEIQEFIDVCDYALGISRQANGSVVPSERPGHFMKEVWNPLGNVAVITAFNFPVAVFGWNAALALVCGNAVLWKGAPTTSLCSVAVTKIVQEVLKKNNIPQELVTLVQGGSDIGKKIAEDKNMALVSFTGSTKVGREVGVAVQKRFGKHLLELGGNNAIIVHQDADIDLAVRSVLFAAVGTAGQRCTTTRRVIIHNSIKEEFISKLIKGYKSIETRIGDPLDSKTLIGPLHTKAAIDHFKQGIQSIKEQGGKILHGGNVISNLSGNFVQPTITSIDYKAPVVQNEIFVPILHTFGYDTIEEAIKINNSVNQGLSSSLFTQNIKSVFEWTGPNGSDCGIINVNIPTNGAEIGGAFGGEKETGGGRESGSDSWKAYMRRGTCTINYSGKLPLAQGVKFE